MGTVDQDKRRVCVHPHCVADGLSLVCGCHRSVCVFGEQVEPVLEIVLAAACHLHAFTLATCATTKTHSNVNI